MNETKKKTILLVEDEVLIALSEKMSLEKYGYGVITSLTGEKAVEIFQANPAIDLVLLDIDLGDGIDGTETATRILKARDIPIVFLSSHSEPEIVEQTEKISSYGYVAKNSKITILDASIKMAFRLFEANWKIVEKEVLFQSFFNSALVGTAINSKDGTWVYVNDTLCGMLGYSREELQKLKWADVTPVHTAVTEREQNSAALKKNNSILFEKKYIRKDGSLIDVSVSTTVIKNPDGTIAHYSSIIQDITGQKRLQETEAKVENRYRVLMELAVYGIVLGSHEGIVTDINEYMCDLVNMKREDIIGKHISLFPFTPESLSESPLRFDSLMKGEIVTGERTLVRADGKEYRIEMRTKMMPDGTYQSMYHDITERKKAEEKIRILLSEKELLLREVHHRIKNNMGTISSLLSLQANALKDPAAVSALEDAQSRLQSMMVLYEKLYQGEEFSDMSVADYLPDLIDEIVGTFPNAKTVTVNKQIGNFSLDIKKMQPLGIIINELLTNIMKHAFDGMEGGIVSVNASEKEGQVVISIADNGKGIGEPLEFNNATGFGLMLVRGLTKQLKGTIRIDKNNGTQTVLEFKK